MHLIFGLRNYRVFGALFIAAVLVGCGQKDEKPGADQSKAAPAAPSKPDVQAKLAPAAPAAAPAAPAAPPVSPAAPSRPDVQITIVPGAPVAPPPPRPPAAGDKWELLGQRQANLKMDRDRIDVGRSQGTFRELRFTVRGAPLEMHEMVVTFGNGSQFKPALKLQFDERTSSRNIDLPGDRRAIKSVDFAYRSANRREGTATVMLYGR